MSSNAFRKRKMAASVAIDLDFVAREATARLSADPAVESVHFLPTDTVLSVWVAIAEDNMAVRRSVYGVEDQMSKLFPDILFDFHAVPVPAGKRMEDFVSAAQAVFRRSAA
jgi:hypothetical protein